MHPSQLLPRLPDDTVIDDDMLNIVPSTSTVGPSTSTAEPSTSTAQTSTSTAGPSKSTTGPSTSSAVPSTSGPSSISFPRSEGQVRPLKRQKQLRLFGSTRSHTELTESDNAKINQALIKMIVTDYQPLRIVEDKGFREFVSKLNPLYTIPSRKVLSSQLLPQLYWQQVDILRQKLSSARFVGVTTDLWTSDSTLHYITVTIHFISNGSLHASALQTSEVKGSQTGAQIGLELSNIFCKWKISEKIVTVVSDNGANIKSAINDHLRKHHHPCIAHTLNLSVRESLNNNNKLGDILKKCRSIVGHFKHSVTAVEKLSQMQQQLNVSVLKVKQDVPTRWNSTHIMLERLVDIKVPLVAVMTNLPKAPVMLGANEWIIVEDCIQILKILNLMTTALSGEKTITLSSIIPLVRGVLHSISSINCKTAVGAELKKDMLSVLSRRLGHYEKDKISAKATFLDPRYKKIGFGIQENAENAEKWILEELESLFAGSSSVSTPVPRQ